jgi:hypothetical protein
VSYEVANLSKSLGQFASGKGLDDLAASVEAAKGIPELKKFIESGISEDVPKLITDLTTLAKTAASDVADTATGLATMIDGQESVIITDGTLADKED